MLKQRRPGAAGVLGAPDAATRGCEVEFVRRVRHTRDHGGPAAAEGSKLTPWESARDIGSNVSARWKCRKEQRRDSGGRTYDRSHVMAFEQRTGVRSIAIE